MTAPAPVRRRVANGDAAIEPRILQRRLDVARDHARRRGILLGGVLGAVALIAVGVGLTRSPVLDVDHVEITGAANTAPAAIERAGGFADGPAMVDIDPGSSARAIERLPWIAQARVVRHWPATIEVSVLERSPIAVVPAGENGWVLVDTTGRILADDRDPPGELVKLHAEVTPGPPGELVDTASRGALRVFDALPAALNGRVTAMATSADAVSLTIDGRIAVAFGPPTGVHEKLVALETLLTRVDVKTVKTIDVRVPTAPVITH